MWFEVTEDDVLLLLAVVTVDDENVETVLWEAIEAAVGADVVPAFVTTEEENDVPLTFGPEEEDDDDETEDIFNLFSFSASWNFDIKFTRLVVSAFPAYIVFGRSLLSLRCMAL